MMKAYARSLLNQLSGSDLLGHEWSFSGSHLKKSPLAFLHESVGARSIVFGDAIWVDRFSDRLDLEYEALHEKVGVSDISGMTLLSMRADHETELFSPCFSKSILTKKDHVMRYGALIEKNGRMFDDAIIYIISPNHLWVTLNASFESFEHFLVDLGLSDQIILEDLTDRYVKIQIQGPDAAVTLNRAYSDLPSIKPFHFLEKEGCLIDAGGFTRAGGYELFLPVDQGIDLWKKLLNMGVMPYGISTMEISRVEAKMICCGHEFSFGKHFPQEVGFLMDRPHCSMDSELRFSIFTHDPRAIRVLPHIGDRVTNAAGEDKGVMTSVVFSPYYDAYIGFCRLKCSYLENDQPFFVQKEPLITFERVIL